IRAGSSERRSFTPGLYVGAVLNLGAGHVGRTSLPYLDERQQLMQWWSDYQDRCAAHVGK
ncbi:hypothetical protein J3Q30_15410, partial [Bordetella holmesii]|uniref:hypothetical protein n=1 Tax=Bordetella holmesii TaxID=35814 RepID=UPI001A99EBFE